MQTGVREKEKKAQGGKSTGSGRVLGRAGGEGASELFNSCLGVFLHGRSSQEPADSEGKQPRGSLGT